MKDCEIQTIYDEKLFELFEKHKHWFDIGNSVEVKGL